MQGKPWLQFLVWLTLCVASTACEERELLPESHPTFIQFNTLQSTICAFTLDRSGLRLDLPELPDREHRILTGYVTTFIPGQPPFACDRLNQWTLQGAFRFNVAAGRGTFSEPFRSVILEITDFTPVNDGIRIVHTEPWGLGFGEGFFSSGRVRNTCRFRLAVASERWPDTTPPGRAGPPIAVRRLRGGHGQFTAPIADTLTFEVGQEVQDWFYGTAPETGFVIMPEEASINFKATNSCLGFFSVRLRAFFGADP
jgi:hypothetical protein